LTIASAGGTATTAIQLSSLDGFSGTVNLTCAVNYQGQGTPNDPPTCSLSPAQVQVTGRSPISSTLTVSTTAASTSARLQRTFNQSLIARRLALPWNNAETAVAWKTPARRSMFHNSGRYARLRRFEQFQWFRQHSHADSRNNLRKLSSCSNRH
jgi:hypothetical protein